MATIRAPSSAGRDKAVMAVGGNRLSGDDVAGGVANRSLPHRIPGPQVRPEIVDRQDGRASRLLHHRDIDRNLPRRRKGGVEGDRSPRRRLRGKRLAHSLDETWRQGLGLVDDHAGAEDEVTAVPQAAHLQERACGADIGLFDELLDRPDAASDVQGAPPGRMYPKPVAG